MSTEAPGQIKEPSPDGSIWSLLKRVVKFPSVVRSVVTEILQDGEIYKQGEPLIKEARDLFRNVPEYETECRKVYTAASNYASLERPMRIGTEFAVGRNRYNVMVTETQGTDPLALLMMVDNIDTQAVKPDVTVDIDLRNLGATTRRHVNYWENGQRDPEYVWKKSTETRRAEAIVATEKIKQILVELRRDLIARNQTAH